MTRYGRNIFQDLANLSNHTVQGLQVDRLKDRYASAVADRKRRETENADAFSINIPHMEMVQKRIAEQLEAEAAELHSGLPVASIYDAYSIVKSARKRDTGVNALQAQLERMWVRDRTGSITADTYLTLYDHYRRNYPKSAASDLIQEVGQRGYATLPLSDLSHIASKINSQADFDHAVMVHGLNGPLPHQVKARRYILALLNDREDQEDQEDRSAEDFMGEVHQHLEELEDLVEDYAHAEDLEYLEDEDSLGIQEYPEDEDEDEDDLLFMGKESTCHRVIGSDHNLPTNVWGVEFDGLDGAGDPHILHIGIIANMDYATNWGGPVAVFISGWRSEDACLEEAYDMMSHMSIDRGDDPYSDEEDGPNFDGYSFTTTVEAFKAAALSSGVEAYQKVLSEIEEELEDLLTDDEDDEGFNFVGRRADMLDAPRTEPDEPTFMVDPPLDGVISQMLEPFITGRQDAIKELADAWSAGNQRSVDPVVIQDAVSKLYAMQGMQEYPEVDSVIDAIIAHLEDEREITENMSRIYRRVASFIRRRRATARVNSGN